MNSVDAAMYSTLSGGTALVAALGGTVIYNNLAPRGATLPYVLFNMQAGIEENQTPRDSQRLVYQVQAVAATLAQAGTIADLAHTLLHKATLTITGGTNFWTARESIIRYTEVVEETGRTIAHVGGEYAIRLTT